MKKTVLKIAVLYAAGALVAPYFVADTTEEKVRGYFNRLPAELLATQGLELSLKDYQRGYFTSNAIIHLKWSDIYTDKTIYESDLKTHISHAPLSLSGLNSHVATTTQAAQPSGTLGQNLPADWLFSEVKHSLLGNINAHNTFKAFDALIDEVNIAFKGAKIDYQAPTNKPEKANIKLAFDGVEIKDEADPISATFGKLNLHAYNAGKGIGRVDIDNLHFSFKDGETDFVNEITLKNFSESVHLLDNATPVALSLSADALSYRIQPPYKDVMSGQIANLALFYGFVSEGKDYRFKLTAKGEPQLNNLPAKVTKLIPEKVDVDISAAPFSQDSVTTFSNNILTDAKLGTLNARGFDREITKLMNENIYTQDLRSTIAIDLRQGDDNMLNVQGEVVEHIQSEDDKWAIRDDSEAVKRLLAGTHLSAQASKHFVTNSGLSFMLMMSGVAPAKLYDEEGNLDAKLEINPDSATLNGEPLPL